MNNATNIVALGFLVIILVACGSGGTDAPADKTFSVSLGNVDIRRVSNGEAVELDTTGVSSSEMILK